jgi:hypothetical protein
MQELSEYTTRLPLPEKTLLSRKNRKPAGSCERTTKSSRHNTELCKFEADMEQIFDLMLVNKITQSVILLTKIIKEKRFLDAEEFKGLGNC